MLFSFFVLFTSLLFWFSKNWVVFSDFLSLIFSYAMAAPYFLLLFLFLYVYYNILSIYLSNIRTIYYGSYIFVVYFNLYKIPHRHHLGWTDGGFLSILTCWGQGRKRAGGAFGIIHEPLMLYRQHESNTLGAGDKKNSCLNYKLRNFNVLLQQNKIMYALARYFGYGSWLKFIFYKVMYKWQLHKARRAGKQ